MRIALLCPDASTNALVRTYPIAKVLERRHEVQVLGFRFGATVFEPYREEFRFEVRPAGPLPGFLRQAREMAAGIRADAVYVFKPLPTSLWVGLMARRLHGIPLFLDIEDDEMSWHRDTPFATFLRRAVHLESTNGILWTWLSQWQARLADEIFAVSRFLQRRFGGTLLPHGADTTFFDPACWPREQALRTLGLEDHRYVVFTGTPNRRKGLHDLLAAVEELDDRSLRVLVVGSFHQDPTYRDDLVAHHGERLVVLGPRPHRDMPSCLAVADVVALPQRDDRTTRAQVPGKVFEAMAMGRPVVATAISDLPEILDGCGVVVPPNSVSELARGLALALAAPPGPSDLGRAARRRCETLYSWDAMDLILTERLDRWASRHTTTVPS